MADPDPLLGPNNVARTQWFPGVDERLGFWSGSMSLAVSMIGTGIVTFPYAFALGGYVAGPAMFFIIAELSYFSYKSLIQCTIVEHVSCYGGGLLRKIPKIWRYYTNLAMWFLLILAMAAYVLIASDMICSFFPVDSRSESGFLENHVLFGIILLALFPLCLMKTFYGMSAISTYCSCAIITVAGLIVWKSFEIWANRVALPASQEMTARTEVSSVALIVPILSGTMFGHMSISQIYAELQPKVKEQAHSIALIACAVCAVLYMAVGLSGYAAFGRSARSNVVAQIIEHIGEGSVALLTQFLMLSFVVLKTPLLLIPLRTLSVELFALGANPSEMPFWGHVGLTFGLLACVYLALVTMPNLGEVLEFNGASCVIPLCFVVPARLSWSLEVPRPAVRCITMGLLGVLASAISLFVIVTS